MDINNSEPKKFYDVEKNVIGYIESCEGKDGRYLVDKLKTYLPTNSAVLELGIGAGTDLKLLKKSFNVTGSDYSQTFLNFCKQDNPNADLLLLDAVTLATNRKFDCIYSNKVLHHLTTNNLRKSINRQRELLNQNGFLLHTFWRGNKRNRFQDLNFIQYEIDDLRKIFKDFQILESNTYQEMNLDDSIYIILKTY